MYDEVLLPNRMVASLGLREGAVKPKLGVPHDPKPGLEALS